MIPWCRPSFSCLVAAPLFLTVLVSVCRVWCVFRLFLCCSVACFGSLWPLHDSVDGICCDVLEPFPLGLELFYYFLLSHPIFFLPVVPSVILVTDSLFGFPRAFSLVLPASATRRCHGWSVGMVGRRARNRTPTFRVPFTTRRMAGYSGFDRLSDPSCSCPHRLGASPSSLSVCI